MTNKLYIVTCKGMQYTMSTTVTHGISYVIAKDPTAAYSRVRKYLDQNDLGLVREREMEKVELIAEETPYPLCGFRLFFA